jgi:REP element-mobilizing transposase RayT
VFHERENYLPFLRRVRRYLIGGGQTSEVSETSEVYASIIAYCLMPNHYHLLICPHDDHLSRRMQQLIISYTKAMNKRYNRVGALFQGQFQAVYVDRDVYLLHLSRYIRLNPVASGLVNRPEDWEFSSYREYVGLRQGTLPTADVVLSQFVDRSEYERFARSYAQGDGDTIAHLVLEDD